MHASPHTRTLYHPLVLLPPVVNSVAERLKLVRQMSASTEPTSAPASLPYGAQAPPLNPAVTHRVSPTDAPYRLAGKVVAGFQRGSKQLGFPTANLDLAAFTPVLPALPRGVYCGWVQIVSGGSQRSAVHRTVLSLGTNPTFGTTEETLEAYVMDWTGGDFYGAEMRLVVCGYVRPQYTMGGLDELIAWIKADVSVTEHTLQQPQYSSYRNDTWFGYTQQPQQPPATGTQHTVTDGREGVSGTNGTERLRSNV